MSLKDKVQIKFFHADNWEATLNKKLAKVGINIVVSFQSLSLRVHRTSTISFGSGMLMRSE